jgi:hypothetical protein
MGDRCGRGEEARTGGSVGQGLPGVPGTDECWLDAGRPLRGSGLDLAGTVAVGRVAGSTDVLGLELDPRLLAWTGRYRISWSAHRFAGAFVISPSSTAAIAPSSNARTRYDWRRTGAAAQVLVPASSTELLPPTVVQ